MSTHRGRARPRSADGGFTLIELLVVVVILGILIAIAIPVYLNYKRSTSDRAAQSDLRGVVATLEQCYGDNSAYPAAATFTAGATPGTAGVVCSGRTGNVSAGTSLNYYPASTTDLTGYIVGATNVNGSGKNYCYNSTKGGAVTATGTAVTTYRALCGP